MQKVKCSRTECEHDCAHSILHKYGPACTVLTCAYCRVVETEDMDSVELLAKIKEVCQDDQE